MQNWRKVAFILAIVGIIQFIILISIAMVFYAGGNSVNPSAPGYSFLLNYWSDLGRVVAWSGKNNIISQVLFSIAMIGWGISFVPSIQALSSLFSESRRGKLFCKIGTISALISVLLLFCEVAFFPVDVHPLPHTILAALGYLTLLIVEILYAIVMFWDENYPNKHAICFLVVAVVICLWAIFRQPVLQKSVTFTLAIATLIVFYDAWKMTAEKNE
ncbi:MAG: hypothetical protein HWN66_07860 [Candidatus Helarchaeota archaeon]|nr:hypothetical protein [Candidatus Helarchaeota archaeon]